MSGVSYASLLRYLVVADFKSDVNRYFLGVFWWIAEPLLYVAVFYVAFSHLRSDDENYVFFLIVGITTWRWLAGSINQATSSIVGKKRIISHFSINPVVFTLASLTTQGLKFLVIFLAVCALLQFSGRLDFAGTQAMLFWTACTFACVIACSLIAAFLVVYLPDFKVLISQALLLLMFLSGVIFEIDSVGEDLAAVLQFNPFIHIISGVRYLLLGQSQGSLDYQPLFVVMLVSSLFVVCVMLLSGRLARDIPKRVML